LKYDFPDYVRNKFYTSILISGKWSPYNRDLERIANCAVSSCKMRYKCKYKLQLPNVLGFVRQFDSFISVKFQVNFAMRVW